MFKKAVTKLAKGIDITLNGDNRGEDKPFGFILVLFEFQKENSPINYVSNATKEGVLAALKELVRTEEMEKK